MPHETPRAEATSADSAAPPEALLCHETSGRFRVRIPDKRKDAAYFEQVRGVMLRAPAVHEVETNAMTGSVLVIHTGDSGSLLEHAEREGLFRRTDEQPQGGTIVDWLDRLDRFDSEFLFAKMERSPQRAATGLFMLAVLQALRGSIIPSAPSLLGEAMRLLRESRSTENDRSKRREP